MRHKHLCPKCGRAFNCTIPYCNGVARRFCLKCERDTAVPEG
jgi:hypothetical protein